MMMNNAIQAFCWMLLHSLWQGLLLTLVVGLVMLLTKRAAAAVRYNLLVVFFVLFLLTCGYTFIREWGSAEATANSLLTSFAMHSVLQEYGLAHWPALLAQYCSGHAMWIVTIWLALFVFRCWQMGRGILYMRRIRTKGLQEPVAGWQQRVNALTSRLNIHKAILLKESALTRVPVVIGHLKPVIYMPLGLLANLPYEQVEAVLLHELAHIRRHDFLVNLLQQVAAAVFFFNPGLLWVSSLISQEREHCCDDIALQHTGKKRYFIEALISFKEHAIAGNRYAVAFPGRKNLLVQRVTRIVQDRNNSLNVPEKWFFVLSLLVVAVLLTAVSNREPLKSALAVKQVKAMPVAETVVVPQVVGAQQKPVAKKQVTRRRETRPGTAQATRQTAEAAAMAYQQDLQQLEAAQQDVIQQKEELKAQQHSANKEREEADIMRAKAEQDRLQAEIERARADEKRREADLYRAAAEKVRKQAEYDRRIAELQRAQAEADRAQAEEYRQRAAVARDQAERGRRNAERARAAAATQHP